MTRPDGSEIPFTDEEWQDAVDAAEACLCIDAAQKYGLITGGPTINVDRCMAILEQGKARGTTPRPDAVERQLRTGHGHG